jgi:amino acid transporter
MHKRISQLFRNHKVTLSLAFLAMASLFFLAISLESLEFESGDIFDTQGGSSILSSFLKLLNFDRFITILLLAFLVLGAIASIYVLSKKELRKEFLRKILQLSIFTAIFVLAFVIRGEEEEVQGISTPTPVVIPTAVSIPDALDDDFEFSQELPRSRSSSVLSRWSRSAPSPGACGCATGNPTCANWRRLPRQPPMTSKPVSTSKM